MENTFTREVKFISKMPDANGAFIETIVTKNATFKELSRTDRSQRDLCWLIREIFYKEKEETLIDREIASKLSDKFVEEMLVINDSFTVQDKAELLNDNGAMIDFGLWLVHEKILPFFLILLQS